jgi:hypothetical protein
MNHVNESVTGPSRVSGPGREDPPPAPLAVREAARAVADRLAAKDAIVLDAIRNRNPRAVAR